MWFCPTQAIKMQLIDISWCLKKLETRFPDSGFIYMLQKIKKKYDFHTWGNFNALTLSHRICCQGLKACNSALFSALLLGSRDLNQQQLWNRHRSDLQCCRDKFTKMSRGTILKLFFSLLCSSKP